MSGDELDLDAVERVLDRSGRLPSPDARALVAEVRRLRAVEASLTEERDTRRETFDTGTPNTLRPGTNLMATRPVVEHRFVTPWERVE